MLLLYGGDKVRIKRNRANFERYSFILASDTAIKPIIKEVN